MGQQVALLAIRIDQATAGAAAPVGAAADSLRELRQHAVDIAAEVRNLSGRLHSPRLEVLGLAAALRGHCQELVAHGVRASFYDEDVPPSLPSDVELCLFRIVQEGLNNIVRHSGADEAQVTLRARDGVPGAERRGFRPRLRRGGRVEPVRAGPCEHARAAAIGRRRAHRALPAGHGTRLTARVPISTVPHHMP